MDSSKVAYISLEDLMYGIFSILVLHEKKLEATYEKLNEYENQVISYFENKNYEIIVDNSIEKQIRFFNKHHEFKIEQEKIILLHQMFLVNREIDEEKKKALFNEQTIELFSEQKELTKNNSII